MGNIVFCTDDFLQEFKVNFDKYIDLYIEKDKDSLDEIFSDVKNIQETNIKFEYKKLLDCESTDNPERENIKNVFETFKDLDITKAIQEKLWVAMYNYYYQDHIFDYVDNNKNHKNFNAKLKGSILFTQGRKRSLIVQNLSRMWWLGYYLYDDENKEDPYWLLDFYTKDKDIIGRSTIFFSSNITNNKNLRLGIVEGIKELTDEEIIKYDRYHYINTAKYFNMLGSVYILDLLDRKEVKKETKNYILNHMVKQI